MYNLPNESRRGGRTKGSGKGIFAARKPKPREIARVWLVLTPRNDVLSAMLSDRSTEAESIASRYGGRVVVAPLLGRVIGVPSK